MQTFNGQEKESPFAKDHCILDYFYQPMDCNGVWKKKRLIKQVQV